MSQLTTACGLLLLACSVGCQSSDGMRPNGSLLRGAFANWHDEQAYAEASPDERFNIDDTPGATSRSWSTAARDYPGALPQ
ncbi:MAG: hypothetical protein AAGJ46_09435 [Planctomycetota bacterium]